MVRLILGAAVALIFSNSALASSFEHCGLQVQVLQLYEPSPAQMLEQQNANPTVKLTQKLRIRILDSHRRTKSKISCDLKVGQVRTIQLKVPSPAVAEGITPGKLIFIDYTYSKEAAWEWEPNRRNFVEKTARISKMSITSLSNKDLDGTGTVHVFGIRGEIVLRFNLENDEGIHEIIRPLHGNPETGECNHPLYAFRTDQQYFGGRLENLVITDFSNSSCDIDVEAMTVVEYLRDERNAARRGSLVEATILADSLTEPK